MGVSRSSLREALRALAMLGVAEMRHGDGTYLTSLEPDALMRPVGARADALATPAWPSSSRPASSSSRASPRSRQPEFQQYPALPNLLGSVGVLKNGLRSRVRLRTDGGLKTAAASWRPFSAPRSSGFGTSVLVAIGCDMARQCHLNSCPTGIATQREDLRANTPAPRIRSSPISPPGGSDPRRDGRARRPAALDELVGRTDLLRGERASRVAPACLMFPRSSPSRRRIPSDATTSTLGPQAATLDDAVIELAGDAIANGEPFIIDIAVRTENRTVGAKVANAITSGIHGVCRKARY